MHRIEAVAEVVRHAVVAVLQRVEVEAEVIHLFISLNFYQCVVLIFLLITKLQVALGPHVHAAVALFQIAVEAVVVLEEVKADHVS